MTIKRKNGSMTLRSNEVEELKRAYMCLFNLIGEFPTSMSEFFSEEDFLNIVKWSARIQGRRFVKEDWL